VLIDLLEYPWWQPFHKTDVLEAQYQQLLQATNCANVACLRRVPEADLAMAAQKTYVMGYTASPKPYYSYGDFYYGPYVDDWAILDLPSREFARGRFSNVRSFRNLVNLLRYANVPELEPLFWESQADDHLN
jgi:hypothetical protein